MLRRRPSPLASFFWVLFLAGIITTHWVWFSLLCLAILWWGPPLWRKMRPSWTGRSMGGGGFNRIPDFQKILEMTRAGIEGLILRTYWDGRRRAFIARYFPMAAFMVYLAGVYVRHFGDETVVLMVRLLI